MKEHVNLFKIEASRKGIKRIESHIRWSKKVDRLEKKHNINNTQAHILELMSRGCSVEDMVPLVGRTVGNIESHIQFIKNKTRIKTTEGLIELFKKA